MTNSRRDFLKNKLFGGILLSTGLPFIQLKNNYFKKTLSELRFNDGEVDWESVRSHFLLAEDSFHFNTASIGSSPGLVINTISEEMNHLAKTAFDGHKYIEKTHNIIADFLTVSPEEIAVTRNATEAMNIVARSLPLKAGDEVILTTHEHIGGAAPWLALQKDKGIKIKLIDLNLNGEGNFELIKDSISEKTRVISFSHITCTTGLILQAKEIIELCRSKKIYSCVDGAQALGMIPVDLKALNPDFYAGSGHKWIHGPLGTGILFMNKNVIGDCTPIFVGAYSDSKYDLSTLTLEYNKTANREEYGTRNTPVILGLGTAVNFINNLGIAEIADRGRTLAQYFRKKLSENTKIEFLTPENPNFSASIVTLRLKGIDNSLIPKKLFDQGHNLRIRSIHENNLNAIRVSFAIFNNSKEIDYLVDLLNNFTEE